MAFVHPRDRAVARGWTDGDPRPWVRFRAELARMLDTGVLEPGDEVCIGHEARDFGIRIDSARKAFDSLVAEGRLLPPSGGGRPYRVPPRGEEA